MTLVLPCVISKVSDAIQVIPFLHHYQNQGRYLISESRPSPGPPSSYLDLNLPKQ